MRKSFTLALATAALAAAMPASAVTIDFESVALGVTTSVTTQGVTFTFLDGTGEFRVEDASPGAPVSGHSLISFFENPGPGSFRASRVGGFSAFSIGCGDFGADDDTCQLSAFDAAGNLLDQDSYFVPAGVFGGGTLSVSSATPIAYVTFNEVGSFEGAIYWDNVEFREAGVVPEPQTYALMALGLAAVAAAARRRRA